MVAAGARRQRNLVCRVFVQLLWVGGEWASRAESDQRPPAATPGGCSLRIDSVVDYAIYMIDLDWRVRELEFGGSAGQAEEIIGQPFANCFSEDQAREIPQQALAAAARTGRFEAGGSAPTEAGSGRSGAMSWWVRV